MVASDVADAPTSEEELAALAARLDVAVDEIEAVYRSIDPSATDDDLRLTINADLWFVLAGRDLADLQSRFNPRTYRYLFAWPSPAFGGVLGAPHGIELPFVFDHFEPMALFLGDDPPAPLAKTMQEAWVSFARNGDPGWPAWSESSRKVMRFDAECSVVDDPDAPKVALWKAIYPDLIG